MIGVWTRPKNDAVLATTQASDSVRPSAWTFNTPVQPVDMSGRARADQLSQSLYLRPNIVYPTLSNVAAEEHLIRGVMSNKGELYRPTLQRPFAGGFKGDGAGTPSCKIDTETNLFLGVEQRILSRAVNPAREVSTRWAQPLPAFGNPQHPDRIILPGLRGGLWMRGNDPYIRQLSLERRWMSDNDPAIYGSGIRNMGQYTGGLNDAASMRVYWRGQAHPI